MSASPSHAQTPYIVITADTHGGNSIDGYREYLDPEFRDEFDAWRGAYSNPAKKHIGGKKIKNWDSEVRRKDLTSDGVVGEVIFPNTVPPFYEKAFHVAPPPTPEQYRRLRAGTRFRRRVLNPLRLWRRPLSHSVAAIPPSSLAVSNTSLRMGPPSIPWMRLFFSKAGSPRIFRRPTLTPH